MDNEYYNKIIITEDNKEYQVIWVSNINSQKCLYILNVNDYSDILFAKVIDNNALDIIIDKEEIISLVRIMNKEMNLFLR